MLDFFEKLWQHHFIKFLQYFLLHYFLGFFVKTTWLRQLTKDMCVTAQGLSSVWAVQATEVVATSAQSVVSLLSAAVNTTISTLNGSIIEHTVINRTETNTNTKPDSKPFATNSFKDYTNTVSRIRRSYLQVAGAN